MTNHRAVSSVTYNILPSNLLVIQHNTSNDVDLSDGDEGMYNDMHCVYDISNDEYNGDTITLPVENIPLVIVEAHNNPSETTDADPFDISLQQLSLSKRFIQ